MARRNNDPTSNEDKAKVRVIFAEVEGNNESVQEALRTMVSAMSRPVRVVQAKALDEIPVIVQQNLVNDSIDDVLVNESAAEEPLQNETNSSRRPRGSGPKTDRNAGIALVPDLNLDRRSIQICVSFSLEKLLVTTWKKYLLLSTTCRT